MNTNTERRYAAFYMGRKIEVRAFTSYEAQKLAAMQFKARKSYDVSVYVIGNEGVATLHANEV